MRNNKGFTLIEIMVVLLILAIVTAVAMLSFNRLSGTRHVKFFSQNLNDKIRLAEQTAMLQSTTIGLEISRSSYAFYQFNQRWQPFILAGTSTTTAMPSTTNLKLSINDNPISIPNEPTQKPQIIFYPSGDITPFKLTLNNQTTITGKLNGDTTTQP